MVSPVCRPMVTKSKECWIVDHYFFTTQYVDCRMLEIVEKKILRRGSAPSKNVPHNSLKHPEVCIEGLLLLTKHAVMTPQSRRYVLLLSSKKPLTRRHVLSGDGRKRLLRLSPRSFETFFSKTIELLTYSVLQFWHWFTFTSINTIFS